MIYREKLFPLSETPNHLPKRNGRRRPKVTVYRWAQAGICGVRLETIYVGGTLHTSRDAIERFFANVTKAKRGESPVISDARIAKQQQRVTQELSDLVEGTTPPRPSKKQDIGRRDRTESLLQESANFGQ